MASQFNSSSSNGSVPRDSATNRLALDNLLRRELRISDPNNAQEVASALLARYQELPQAISITKEAEGVPFLTASAAPPLVTQGNTSSNAELEQAINDVEKDLRELISNTVLKDVTPELEGWAMAIRSAIQEGVNAARYSLDPRQRDKALGIRRTLGDYARIARLVGALTPSMNTIYRKFAQSLDEVASVLFVMMEEALANIGFSGGRYLLQVPYTELQVRRDAVVYALRNLVGATQEAYGPNDWPRGLDAYRRLYDALESQGQGDLRALLLEHEIARIMDNLIQRAAHGSADGLRAVGSTALLDLERFRRLVIVGHRLIRPESPTLTTFLSAVQLFVDAFQPSGGYRLMRVARPPILFYGLYGSSGLDAVEERLLRLVIYRNQLAEKLDCFMQCGCEPAVVKCQIILDKILYDVDRAIDLYAVSSDNSGGHIIRASAYSFLIDPVIGFVGVTPYACLEAIIAEASGTITGQPLATTLSRLNEILTELRNQLRPQRIGNFIGLNSALRVWDELSRFSNVVVNDLSGVTANIAALEGNPCAHNLPIGDPIADAINERRDHLSNLLTANPIEDLPLVDYSLDPPEGIVPLFRHSQQGLSRLADLEISSFAVPANLRRLVGVLQQELCIQKDMEERWQNLVRTMAPSCIPYADVFGVTTSLVIYAIDQVGGVPCTEFDVKLPPHFETSLDSIAQDVDSDGGLRP